MKITILRKHATYHAPSGKPWAAVVRVLDDWFGFSTLADFIEWSNISQEEDHENDFYSTGRRVE